MDKLDCDCNILKLSECSKQLKTLEKINTNDYIYLKCYIFEVRIIYNIFSNTLLY